MWLLLILLLLLLGKRELDKGLTNNDGRRTTGNERLTLKLEPQLLLLGLQNLDLLVQMVV